MTIFSCAHPFYVVLILFCAKSVLLLTLRSSIYCDGTTIWRQAYPFVCSSNQPLYVLLCQFVANYIILCVLEPIYFLWLYTTLARILFFSWKYSILFPISPACPGPLFFFHMTSSKNKRVRSQLKQKKSTMHYILLKFS